MPELFYCAIMLVMYACLVGASAIGFDALLVLMGMITITGNVIVGKILVVFGYQLNPGAALAVGLYWIGSLLTQFYGVREAKKALWVNFASLIFLTVVGWLAMKSPGGIDETMDTAVTTIFSFMPSVMVAALMSFGAAYLFNIFVQRRIQKKTHGLHWAVQAGLVAIANLIDIAIFCTVAYFGKEDCDLIQMILTTWAVRLAVIVCGIPVILMIRHFYKTGKFPILKPE